MDLLNKYGKDVSRKMRKKIIEQSIKLFAQNKIQLIPMGREITFTCPICCAENNDCIIMVTCNGSHKFHRKCIMPWLNYNIKCPISRGVCNNAPPVNNEEKQTIIDDTKKLITETENIIKTKTKTKEDKMNAYRHYQKLQRRKRQIEKRDLCITNSNEK
jgi:hypothetical protein